MAILKTKTYIFNNNTHSNRKQLYTFYMIDNFSVIMQNTSGIINDTEIKIAPEDFQTEFFYYKNKGMRALYSSNFITNPYIEIMSSNDGFYYFSINQNKIGFKYKDDTTICYLLYSCRLYKRSSHNGFFNMFDKYL